MSTLEPGGPVTIDQTRWVLTLRPSDGGVMHVELASEEEGRQLLASMPDPDYELLEVPVTWRCDGRDGCTVMA